MGLGVLRIAVRAAAAAPPLCLPLFGVTVCILCVSCGWALKPGCPIPSRVVGEPASRDNEGRRAGGAPKRSGLLAVFLSCFEGQDNANNQQTIGPIVELPGRRLLVLSTQIRDHCSVCLLRWFLRWIQDPSSLEASPQNLRVHVNQATRAGMFGRLKGFIAFELLLFAAPPGAAHLVRFFFFLPFFVFKIK